MKAVNLTLSPVELAPVNGPGMLRPADDYSDGEHERELAELTDRERALERAGTIALVGESPSPDTYDGMEREALEAEVASREGLTVTREDGRTDRPVPLNELRHALRVHDTTGGES